MVGVVADKVIVELEAKLDQYNANVTRAEKNFSRSMGNIERSAGTTERFVTRSAAAMTAAFAGVSAIAVAQAFLAVAERAKQMDAQLRLATATYGSFAQAQEDSRRIAQNTRSGLEETTKLYGNFIRASQETGRSQAEAARATETFTKALKLGGAGAQETASATLQFSQALASGVLRGDEFNSIMEASPRLARLLATALGVPIGQLRAMAEEGQITADVLFKALTDKKFTAGIDNEFKTLPVTFDEAMTQIGNTATIVFGAFDRGGEFSTALANFIIGGVGGFDDLEQAAEQFGIEVRSTLEGLGSAFKPLVDAGLEAFQTLTKGSKSWALVTQQDIRTVLGALDSLTSVASRFGLYGLMGGEGTNYLGRYNAAQQAAQQRLTAERALGGVQDRTGGDWFRQIMGETTSRSGSASASSGKKAKLKTPKGKQVQTLEEWLNQTAIDVSNDVFKQAGASAEDFNRDSSRAYDDAMREVEKRLEAERDLKRQYDEEAFRRQEDQILTLANLYEDAFRGGTKAIWSDFKQIGMRIVAEVLARFAITNLNGGSFNLGSALSTAIGAVLPGFAGGGSGVIGGRGGTDNNVLSLNGKPFANVTRGERLSIGNQALSGRGGGAATVVQNITVDARNSVNPDGFARQILTISAQQAQQAATTMGSTVIKAMPARLAQYQTDGT